MPDRINIFWFRRDLRTYDNTALSYALKAGKKVIPIFILDRNILDSLEKDDKRVEFIRETLIKLQKELSLEVYYGFPLEIFSQLIDKYNIENVYTNHDYEPYAIRRDKRIRNFLEESRIGFHTYKDQVIFEKDEIVKEDGKPYTVFTPYSRKWLNKLASIQFKKYKRLDLDFLDQYKDKRDHPAADGTSRLGIHLRFGTISIRQLVQQVKDVSPTFLNELIWREFFQSILWHFPDVVDHSFKSEYDRIPWRNNEKEFQAWCDGKTGYPIVDAGMRELNATGFMHNRVRMITASFLCKHLLIDWRWGEAYFAEKLLDFELASNNGNWQWAAGSGCDAAPYFRIFNPSLQAKKFDPENKYIRKWVPEFEEKTYPSPIVEHEMARKRCLEVYAKALRN